LDGRLVLHYAGYAPHLEYIKAGLQFDEEQKARKRQAKKANTDESSEEEEIAQHERELHQAMIVQMSLPWDAEPEAEAGAKDHAGVSSTTDKEISGITFGAARLWRDPRTKQWYLPVTLELPKPDPTPESYPNTNSRRK
jgi:hypothetical protein